MTPPCPPFCLLISYSLYPPFLTPDCPGVAQVPLCGCWRLNRQHLCGTHGLERRGRNCGKNVPKSHNLWGSRCFWSPARQPSDWTSGTWRRGQGLLMCFPLTSEPTPRWEERCHMFNRSAIPSVVAIVTGDFSWRVVTASVGTKRFEQVPIGNLTLFSGCKSREKSGGHHNPVTELQLQVCCI